MSDLELRGVRVHNLKGIDLRFPLGQLIAITGVSGAGKSSLAFDTLVAEGRRRYIETFATSARQWLERIERPDADSLDNLPPAVPFQADSTSPPNLTVGAITEVDDLLNVLMARAGEARCPQCHRSVTVTTPDNVVREVQAMPDGVRFVIAFPARDSSIETWKQQGFVRAISVNPRSTPWVVESCDAATGFAEKTSDIWIIADRLTAGQADSARLLESVAQAFEHGEDHCVLMKEHRNSVASPAIECEWDGRRWSWQALCRHLFCSSCELSFPALEPDLFSPLSPLGACVRCHGLGQSDASNLGRSTRKRRPRAEGADNGSVARACEECAGSRLQPFGRNVQLTMSASPMSDASSATMVDLRNWPIVRTQDWLRRWAEPGSATPREELKPVLREIAERLKLLIDLRLGNLSLSRPLAAMSRGERLRVRLAGTLAIRLDNALYVFEEPACGLTSHDITCVLAAIRRLQQSGNTVVVVEHRAELVRSADHVVELGPGAGKSGGEILFQGAADESPLVRYRSRHQRTMSPSDSGSRPALLSASGITCHGLVFESVRFPLNALSVLTGPSGCGKSAILEQALFPAICHRLKLPVTQTERAHVETLGELAGIDDAIFIDSSPLRKSLRANAATVLGIMAEIRHLFALTTEAKLKNFSARHFSFNAADGGRCPRCRGLGLIEVDMQFLANLEVTCPECHGSRFQREVLEAKLRGLSIADVLNLSAEEAFPFFRGHPKLQRRLKSLKDVGLAYLPLGQPANTLSRGECQRLKLAERLSSSQRKRTLFLLDEPTTGLHPADVDGLLDVLRRLIEVGHSVIAIENQPDFVAAADFVLECPTARLATDRSSP